MREAKNITILLVDDEEILREAMAFDFKRKGFMVFTAENGRKAFNIVQSEKIDIVVTDVRMPNGDGLELLDKIKMHDAYTPVVMFITGFADISLEQAYHRGVDAIFSKPFDRKEILASIIKLVSDKSEVWGRPQVDLATDAFCIELTFSNLSSAQEANALKVGRGGIALALGAPLPQLQSRVLFKINFEGGELKSLEGGGVVRWLIARLGGDQQLVSCGIEIEFLSEPCRKDFIELVEQNQIKPFIPVI